MGFPRPKYWNGLLFPFPGGLPNLGIQLKSPALTGGFLTTEPPGKPLATTAAAAKLLQSCLTLCDPIDGSPPGSAVSGILQAKVVEWVAIAFSQQTPTEGVISYHVSLPDLCLLDLMGGKRRKTVFSCSQFRQA